MTVMTYADAAKAALAEEMRRDPLVWAVGEDLGRGGVFGQYKGLAEEFGPERISDAPISEAAIMGASVGAAMAGTRPVVEMRFADFALCAVDELVNQAANARYMLGGQTKAHGDVEIICSTAESVIGELVYAYSRACGGSTFNAS